MDPSLVVDRSTGASICSAKWRHAIPHCIANIGITRQCRQQYCSVESDFVMSSQHPTHFKMPFLRLNSQGDCTQDEFDYRLDAKSAKVDFRQPLSGSVRKWPDHNMHQAVFDACFSWVKKESCTLARNCQPAQLMLARAFRCKSANEQQLDSEGSPSGNTTFSAKTLCQTACPVDLGSKLRYLFEDCSSLTDSSCYCSYKPVQPLVSSADALSRKEHSSVFIEVPVSAISCNQSQHVDFRVIPNGFDLSIAPILLPHSFILSYSIGSLQLCLKVSDGFSICSGDKFENNDTVQMKVCCSRQCGARARFLCKRKNSLNFRGRSITRCKVRKSWHFPCSSIGSENSSSKHCTHLSSLKEDESDDSDSSSSANEEDCHTYDDSGLKAIRLGHKSITDNTRYEEHEKCCLPEKKSQAVETSEPCRWKSNFASFFCASSEVASSSCSSDSEDSDDDWDTSGFSSPSGSKTTYENNDNLFVKDEATNSGCAGIKCEQYFTCISSGLLSGNMCCENDTYFLDLEKSCGALVISSIDTQEQPIEHSDEDEIDGTCDVSDEDEIDGTCDVSHINLVEINERWNREYGLTAAVCSSGDSRIRMVCFLFF
jgi:hypothetical protein